MNNLDSINNFSKYKDFNDYCKSTGQDKYSAIKVVFEYINKYSDRLKQEETKYEQ